MRWLVSLALTASVAGLVWIAAVRQNVVRPPATRTVAFDNVYAGIKTITVHVKVDGGTEQTLTATCTVETCTFALPLSNGSHTLAMAVTVKGERSRTSTVTLDAGKPAR